MYERTRLDPLDRKVELYYCAIDPPPPVPGTGSKKTVHVLLCLCNNACKRSLAKCRKSRAECPVHMQASVCPYIACMCWTGTLIWYKQTKQTYQVVLFHVSCLLISSSCQILVHFVSMSRSSHVHFTFISRTFQVHSCSSHVCFTFILRTFRIHFTITHRWHPTLQKMATK